MKKIVVLISGNGSNLQAIIDSCESGDIDGEITNVISNKNNAYGLQRAIKANIPTKILDDTCFNSREEFDKALFSYLLDVDADLIVLAGFMKILNKKTTDHFYGKIINIHPSLLPKYPGLNTHTKVIENKDIYHGISIHYVSSELDAGPIIAQGKIDVKVNESLERLEDRIHKLEHIIYPKIIDLICKNEIYLENDSVRYLHNTGSKEYICNTYEI
jgi:phosphoribosylglycinamide formyltransferase-1